MVHPHLFRSSRAIGIVRGYPSMGVAPPLLKPWGSHLRKRSTLNTQRIVYAGAICFTPDLT
jgi:hypothetical protein